MELGREIHYPAQVLQGTCSVKRTPKYYPGAVYDYLSCAEGQGFYAEIMYGPRRTARVDLILQGQMHAITIAGRAIASCWLFDPARRETLDPIWRSPEAVIPIRHTMQKIDGYSIERWSFEVDFPEVCRDPQALPDGSQLIYRWQVIIDHGEIDHLLRATVRWGPLSREHMEMR